jgi:hypothetical protein
MGSRRIRQGLAFGTALVAGGALALPFASHATSTLKSATTSAGATSTGTTTTTTTTTTMSTPKPAPKPLPPLAYSGYVEQITPSSALLKARINPRGVATQYYFAYGLTASYGSETPLAAAGGGTAEVKVTGTVGGLLPNTTYHFRVVAVSSAGTAAGTDATFTTKKVPLSLTATAAPSTATFGSSLEVSGALAGTGNAGVEVVLQASPFPYAHGFHDITTPELTSASGTFSFPLAGLLQSTQLRVATASKPTIISPVIAELVMVRVTLHARPARRHGFVRLYGTVTPAEPGAGVAFERLVHGRYVAVSGTVIRARTRGVSHFSRTLRLHHHGHYRALVQIASGGPQVAGRSQPIVIR